MRTRLGGDSYYVLVNNNGDTYESEDPICGTYGIYFDTWEDAEEELKYLLGEGEISEEDGWHVERHRW